MVQCISGPVLATLHPNSLCQCWQWSPRLAPVVLVAHLQCMKEFCKVFINPYQSRVEIFRR